MVSREGASSTDNCLFADPADVGADNLAGFGACVGVGGCHLGQTADVLAVSIPGQATYIVCLKNCDAIQSDANDFRANQDNAEGWQNVALALGTVDPGIDVAVGSDVGSRGADTTIPPYARTAYNRVPQGVGDSVIGTNQICVYCGVRPSTHVDHIDPLKNDWETGGWNDDLPTRSARANDPANLTGACGVCNPSKGARLIGQGPGLWWPPGWDNRWWPFGGGPGS